MSQLQIGIIGSAGSEEYPKTKPNQHMFVAAQTVASALAKKGCVIITGGKGGVMEAAAKGAKLSGGTTVAEIAGNARGTANEYIDIEIVTCDVGFRGPSQLIGMCDGIISLGGGAGTLQELCVAYRMQKPVVLLYGFGGWTDRLSSIEWLDERHLVRFTKTTNPEQAVKKLLNLLKYM